MFKLGEQVKVYLYSNNNLSIYKTDKYIIVRIIAIHKEDPYCLMLGTIDNHFCILQKILGKESDYWNYWHHHKRYKYSIAISADYIGGVF
jgi:hypothetical protein